MPELNDRLGRLQAYFGTELESWAMDQAYAAAPRADFSRSILQQCPRVLAVSKLPDVTWCDLGGPARFFKTVNAVGLCPPWFERALVGLKDAS